MGSAVDLQPDLLRAFVTVVECGTFSAAAKRLLRSQSAISLKIKRLESQLGVKLLARNTRRIALTSEGEMLLDHARHILRLNDELLARYEEQEISGSVRLGAPEDFATTHLPNVLSSFARSHPQVTLEVTCELTMQLIERFQSGGLDLALVKREPSGNVGGIRVWREPLVWVSARGGFDDMPAVLPLVVSPRPCVYRKRATDSLDRNRLPWRIAYTCGALAGSLAAVRAGLGISVLPKQMVPQDLRILNDELSKLPNLDDTEMALIEAPLLSRAGERLRDYIVRELETGAGQQAVLSQMA